jgi:predicted tellurium resistance membrane protein TerC
MTIGMKIKVRILVDMVIYVSRLVSENKTLYYNGCCVLPYLGFKLIADF